MLYKNTLEYLGTKKLILKRQNSMCECESLDKDTLVNSYQVEIINLAGFRVQLMRLLKFMIPRQPAVSQSHGIMLQ